MSHLVRIFLLKSIRCPAFGYLLIPACIADGSIPTEQKSNGRTTVRTKIVPNDYLEMSCGGIGIVLRPPAPIQSLFRRNLEEAEEALSRVRQGFWKGTWL